MILIGDVDRRKAVATGPGGLNCIVYVTVADNVTPARVATMLEPAASVAISIVQTHVFAPTTPRDTVQARSLFSCNQEEVVPELMVPDVRVTRTQNASPTVPVFGLAQSV